MEKSAKRKGQMDFALYITVILLCAFGLVMVFSASYYYAQNNADLDYDGLYYLKNQAKYLVVGLVVMITLSHIDYHRWEKYRTVALLATIVLMIMTVFWGEEINGARRWLNIFGLFTFQPSEFAKFALILYMASFMARHPARMKDFVHGVVPLLIIMFAICVSKRYNNCIIKRN